MNKGLYKVLNKPQGFSLSEAVISLFIATIIMTTLMQMYLLCKQQYTKTQTLLSEKLDIQWVSALLTDSIRRAGFTPCLGIDKLVVEDRRANKHVIAGLYHQNQPKPLIKVQRMHEQFASLLRIQNKQQILTQQGVAFNPNRPLIIADCMHAEIHNIERVDKELDGVAITLKEPLVFNYVKSVAVGEWLEERWFIKEKSANTTSLYYQLIQSEELTPLVRHFNVAEQKIRNQRLIRVELILDAGKTYSLDTVVRGAG